ncbi:MAG: band 7 protein [Lachnospiraceae bacterium]|jgi:regulator of protease activity HflC (stomatin/prohibitin superfamily)|nr:band 7 protein [Lachnospiraceae bacterium]
MSNESKSSEKAMHQEEIIMKATSGMAVLLLNSLLIILSIVCFVYGIGFSAKSENPTLGIVLIIVGALYGFIIGPILFAGLKILKPNEAIVLTLFGKYHGTLKGEGFFYVNPFCQAVNPATKTTSTGSLGSGSSSGKTSPYSGNIQLTSHKISLKAMTLNNDKQKVNDQLGNPVIIGIVVVWKVINTAQAVFNVDNFTEFLSIQADSSLRDIVRLYPYDAPDSDEEKSLRGSSEEVAGKLKSEIQSRVNIAGLEVIEARITHLSYAQEIASAMLQRQQASAIIAARQMIVEGAVGMVEMALEKLNEKNIVNLDEERKAAMVSNLLVVLCGNKDAQPIVNSGSIY